MQLPQESTLFTAQEAGLRPHLMKGWPWVWEWGSHLARDSCAAGETLGLHGARPCSHHTLCCMLTYPKWWWVALWQLRRLQAVVQHKKSQMQLEMAHLVPTSELCVRGMLGCALLLSSNALTKCDAAGGQQEGAAAHQGSSRHQESWRSLASGLAGGTCLHQETWGTRAPLEIWESARVQATSAG